MDKKELVDEAKNKVRLLVKKTITQFVFQERISTEDDMRYIKLRYDSEGAGRFFVLTDESDFDGKGNEIHLHHPDDFKMLYEASKEMWEQGSIFADAVGC